MKAKVRMKYMCLVYASQLKIECPSSNFSFFLPILFFSLCFLNPDCKFRFWQEREGEFQKMTH